MEHKKESTYEMMRAPETLPVKSENDWGKEVLDTSDILIPRVLLMQPMSELVTSDRVKVGDLLKSTTKEVLGNKENPFKFIPILSFKTWILEEKIGQRFEFRGIEEMNAGNKDDELEWKDATGNTFRRNRCINFYALLPEDIRTERNALEAAGRGELPDPDDALLPILISFQRTGYQAGKELITHFAKAQHFQIPPAVTTFQMRSVMEKNDKGTYYVPAVDKFGKTSVEDLAVCKKWYETLSKSRVKVDEEGAGL